MPFPSLARNLRKPSLYDCPAASPPSSHVARTSAPEIGVFAIVRSMPEVSSNPSFVNAASTAWCTAGESNACWTIFASSCEIRCCMSGPSNAPNAAAMPSPMPPTPASTAAPTAAEPSPAPTAAAPVVPMTASSAVLPTAENPVPTAPASAPPADAAIPPMPALAICKAPPMVDCITRLSCGTTVASNIDERSAPPIPSTLGIRPVSSRARSEVIRLASAADADHSSAASALSAMAGAASAAPSAARSTPDANSSPAGIARSISCIQLPVPAAAASAPRLIASNWVFVTLSVAPVLSVTV